MLDMLLLPDNLSVTYKGGSAMTKAFLFAGLAGYCGDSVWFGGVHAASLLHVLRGTANGILMGIGHFI
jgi:hypothetical protein